MKLAVGLFLLLQTLDLASTIAILRMVGGDPAIEANPIGRFLIVQAGCAGLVWGKAYMLIVLWTLMQRLPESVRLRLVDFGNGIMYLVVLVNCVSLCHAVKIWMGT